MYHRQTGNYATPDGARTREPEKRMAAYCCGAGVAAGVVALVRLGLDPDGEELGAEVAFAGGFEVEVAAVERVGEVVALIDDALGRVGVGVNDDGGSLHFFGGKVLGHF